jgi:hypothetical protein
MIRMTRRGPARFWLLVAAVAAASAAFGIHPEPPSAIPDGALEISAAASVESPIGPHDCLACRAHRPLVSAPAPFLVASPERSAVRRALARSVSLRPVVLPRSAGRAPPASA